MTWLVLGLIALAALAALVLGVAEAELIDGG
jgi:hypothetical protein